jgi:hypothetical protein
MTVSEPARNWLTSELSLADYNPRLVFAAEISAFPAQLS